MVELAERFKDCLENNPQIYEAFERFTLQAINAGRQHLGAKTIIERMRWYSTVEERGGMFKVNNDYAPFLSRMFEQRHPQYKGFFMKRSSIADMVAN